MELTPFFEDSSDVDSQWSRISNYRPKLYAHIEVSFHSFRGEAWYVLLDPARQQTIRVNRKTFNIISQFDGTRNVKDIYNYLAIYQQDQNYDKSELIDILSRLLELKILAPGVNLNTSDFIQQKEREGESLPSRGLFNPLAIKIPLFNPDRFFALVIAKAPSLFSGPFLWLSLVFMIVVATFSIASYTAIKNDLNAAESYLANNALLLVVSFVFLKFIHELAHGVCLKRYGRTSLECGISVMVFMPIPYVDASSAWSLSSKWQRILVSLSGIYTDLFFSCIALCIYLLSSNELINNACLGVATVGIASSVLFNANPLLKFDGYYVLEDLIEIPDLFDRSKRYCKSIYKNLIFAKPFDTDEPKDIQKILLLYGHGAILFRVFLSFVIAIYLIETFFFIGVLLACFMIYQQLIKPLCALYRYITKEVFLHPNANTATLRSGVLLTLALVLLFYIPVDSSKTIQGVSWIDQKSQLVSPQYARLKKVHVKEGEVVSEGDALFSLESEYLKSQILLERSKLKTLETDYFASFSDRTQKLDFVAEIKAQKEKINTKNKLLSDLDVRSHSGGTLIWADDYLLNGRWFEKGQVIAYILKEDHLLLRAAIDQDHLELIKKSLNAISVRLASDSANEYEAKLRKIFPKADMELPHAALAMENGGQIISSFNGERGGYYSKREIVILEIEVPTLKHNMIGERAYIKLHFNSVSVFQSLSRKFKQLFFKKLNTI